MKLIFFDWDEVKLRGFEARLRSALGDAAPFVELEFVHFTFDDFLGSGLGVGLTSVVSPANCFLFMDGGIDAAYLAAWPEIQRDAQGMMRSFGLKTALGRSFLPIGSALRVETGEVRCPTVVCVPTMFFPSDIRGSQNVQHAFWAALRLFKPNEVAGVPLLDTGVGLMTAEDCADQVAAALRMPSTVEHGDLKAETTYGWYVRSQMACAQPNTYANSEIDGDTRRVVF
jgi:O-acetyl-ADP-ribose deacetylase (regulator of RNase III)